MSLPAAAYWTDQDAEDHGDYIIIGGNKLWRRGIWCPAEYFAHLCPYDRRFYFYIGDDMRSYTINKAGSASYTPAQRYGRPTSRGYLVPLREVSFIQTINAPDCPNAEVFERLNKSERGYLAEHLFRTNVPHSKKTERALDLDGVDFIVNGDSWQIKYDGIGGYRGSGNLWVETHTVSKAEIGGDF